MEYQEFGVNHIYQEPEEDPREVIMKILITIFVFFAVCGILVGLSSCSPKVIETTQIVVKTDTAYIKQIQRDSIYQHDSIFINQYMKGDTIYREQTKWLTKYVEKLKVDTTYISKTDTLKVYEDKIVEVKKPLSWWQKTRLILCNLALICAAVWLL